MTAINLTKRNLTHADCGGGIEQIAISDGPQVLMRCTKCGAEDWKDSTPNTGTEEEIYNMPCRDIDGETWIRKVDHDALLATQKSQIIAEVEGMIETHICRFNDGEQVCDCFKAAEHKFLDLLKGV